MDIATNPGPIKYHCGSCAKPVRSNQHVLQCDDCNIWSHRTCLPIRKDEYLRLSDSDGSWYCSKCIIPNFTDSFFSSSTLESSVSSDNPVRDWKSPTLISRAVPWFWHPSEECEEACDIFKELRDKRKGTLKIPILYHLYINSLRHKFNGLKPVLLEKLTMRYSYIQ